MRTPRSILAAALPLLAILGCATAPPTRAGREDLKESAVSALSGMERSDPSLTEFLRDSAGYAVFPHVGKGAYIVGGGYGRGVVYRGGAEVGYADITQASIGLQAGGQSYMEVLAFQSQGDLDRFTVGGLAFGANLSAVILKTGAASSAPYTNGVAVFVKPIAGAMIEASVGGQQFTYRPE